MLPLALAPKLLRWPGRLSALAAVLVLAGCSGPPASLSYFPLEAGHRWVYDQTSEWENNTVEHEAVVLSTMG